MKLLVLFCSISLCFSPIKSDMDASKESQSKLSASGINSLTGPQKAEYQYQNIPKYRYQTVYQPSQLTQQQNHFQYVIPQGPALPGPQQYDVGKKLLVPVQQQHQQPAAMIIIAQPAYVPANMLYGNIAQQLLHYFQTNPQARHQLVQGAYSHQPQYIQPIAHAPQHNPAPYQPTVGVAIPVGHAHQQAGGVAIPVGHAHQQAAPVGHAHQPTAAPTHQTVYQLGQIAQAAQHAAQQYVAPTASVPQPIKTAPAIITGFENFTPEQQEKIKAQLSQHFGPLQPLNVGNNQAVRVANSGPQNNYFPSIKYQVSGNNNLGSDEFVPSQQVKSNENSEDEEEENKNQYGSKM